MGELMRRVEELVRQITDVSNKMREDRIHAEATFVRRDVYDANRAAEDRRNIEASKDVDDLNRHREADAQWRRQIMLAIAVLAITTLVTVAIAVSNYVAR
jgi:hypothetical protein